MSTITPTMAPKYPQRRVVDAGMMPLREFRDGDVHNNAHDGANNGARTTGSREERNVFGIDGRMRRA